MDSQGQLPAGRPSPAAPGIRASDAEREGTVTQLNQHAVDGRLSPEEFSERVERALAARTRDELDVLLADLPAPPAPAPAAGGPGRRGWIPPRLPAVALALAAVVVLAGLAAGWGGWPGPPFGFFPFFPLFPLLFWGFLLATWARSGSRR